MEACNSSPMENPGLLFFSNCKHSIRLIPTTPRNPDNPEDIAKKYEDHIHDMLRYRVLSEKGVVESSDFRAF